MLAVDPLDFSSPWELVFRLGLASIIGLLLGLDREIHGQEAGLRTHALVALSSAMIMVSSLMFSARLGTDGWAPDPLRSIQGLSQAIGFIAAGLIFVRSGTVRNITTAANVWIAAAVGIACGCGQYGVVLIGSIFAMILLTLMQVLKRYLPSEKSDDTQA